MNKKMFLLYLLFQHSALAKMELGILKTNTSSIPILTSRPKSLGQVKEDFRRNCQGPLRKYNRVYLCLSKSKTVWIFSATKISKDLYLGFGVRSQDLKEMSNINEKALTFIFNKQRAQVSKYKNLRF